jgi:tRNA(adenine34) deaminase
MQSPRSILLIKSHRLTALARRRRRLIRIAMERRSSTGVESESSLDVRMMRRALALAGDAARMGEVPIGAVVYQGERIIAEAHNIRETNADPTGHAELLAIRKAAEILGNWRLTGCTLAVTLEPCAMCAGAMVNARIDRLVYGATDPKAGAVSTLYEIPTDPRLNHRLEVTGGVLADDCGAILSNFFVERRRINRQRRLEEALFARNSRQSPSSSR